MARPTRVVMDADTALISGDTGQRVINAIAENSSALDACLTDAVKLLERGALPSMRIAVDTKGKLTELALDLRRGVTDSGDVNECTRKVLGKVDFGRSEFQRSGVLYFKGDPPLLIRTDPDAEVAKLTKTEEGLEYTLEARRVRQESGDFHLALAVTVTNKSDTPRGVRTTLYSNDEAQRDAKANIHNSGVLQTDTTLPITCLAPGKSLRIEQQKSEADVTVAPGGRRYSDVFLVVGGCDAAGSQVMLGGARLDWAKATPKPSVVALPSWAHHLDPFMPRTVWRYTPSSGGKK
jgi:hypothetical protein